MKILSRKRLTSANDKKVVIASLEESRKAIKAAAKKYQQVLIALKDK